MPKTHPHRNSFLKIFVYSFKKCQHYSSIKAASAQMRLLLIIAMIYIFWSYQSWLIKHVSINYKASNAYFTKLFHVLITSYRTNELRFFFSKILIKDKSKCKYLKLKHYLIKLHYNHFKTFLCHWRINCVFLYMKIKKKLGSKAEESSLGHTCNLLIIIYIQQIRKVQ